MKNYNKSSEVSLPISLDYSLVRDTMVIELVSYIRANNIKSLVLGISGGIDSTVTAAICREACDHTGIPLIGRSLPLRNKHDEFNISILVGKAFCDDFKAVNLVNSYLQVLGNCTEGTLQTPIANGNIQARLRMIYLYNLASLHNGIVISTDNQTEYQLGFWTLHGDVGDFNPLFGLWKTEVYGLANYLINEWSSYGYLDFETDRWIDDPEWKKRINALNYSIGLTPTDGLGISNSDLEQIGATSYDEVDDILKEFFAYQKFVNIDMTLPLRQRADEFLRDQEMLHIDIETIKKVMDRHVNSEFKRKNLPICIERSAYELRE